MEEDTRDPLVKAREEKIARLPIEKTQWGYMQKVVYRQPDLHDEEVIELDSPFAPLCQTGTLVYTFLLLGDQNAGKSTFLHSFSYDNDPNFLSLTSYLPMLSTTFINSRFLGEAQGKAPLDEPPFLDTDLARATVLLTLEDFVFFLREFELPVDLSSFPTDTRFAVLQFIELGGDHLDALMGEAPILSAELKDLLERSKALLSQARRTVYFINAATLLERREGHWNPVPSALSLLKRRLAWLNSVFPVGHEVLIQISRLPEPADGVDTDIALLLRTFAKEEGWKLRFVAVERRNHISAVDLSLNVDEIVATLVSLFRNEMVHSREAIEPFVIHHLLECFKDTQSRLLDAGDNVTAFRPWISEDIFREYLDELHFCEVPPTALLQKFASVSAQLARRYLCLENGADGPFSCSAAIFCFGPNPNERWLWAPPVHSHPQEGGMIRFPFFPPLLELINSYGHRNVPTEMWLGEALPEGQFAPPSFMQDSSIHSALIKVVEELVTGILDKWKVLPAAVPSRHQFEAHACTFFWMVEDWCLACRLLGHQEPILRFPALLPAILAELQAPMLSAMGMEEAVSQCFMAARSSKTPREKEVFHFREFSENDK